MASYRESTKVKGILEELQDKKLKKATHVTKWE